MSNPPSRFSPLSLPGWRHRASRFLPVGLALLLVPVAARAEETELRPPSVPLVTHDPLFSIWSPSDRLTDTDSVHWTGRKQALAGLIRVDGKAYRLMGTLPAAVEALPQVKLTILPTRSIYEFQNAAVHVNLTFTSPLLPDDAEVLTRPVTYLTWDVSSVDGHLHAVSLFASEADMVVVNKPGYPVEWGRESVPGLVALKTGAAEPTLLRPSGDSTTINWGHAFLAAPQAQTTAAAGSAAALAKGFAETGKLSDADDTRQPRPANDDAPALALAFDAGQVGPRPVSRHLMLALDEVYSVRFLGERERPYWSRNGAKIADLLVLAEHNYPALQSRCEAFDKRMLADMTRAGGELYARMGALAYRQALAGCGYSADARGMLMIWAKENSSNGCIATTDVFFPAAPQFLLMGSAYAKGLVAPVLVYSTSSDWKHPFAPHDIGVYPRADGQVYGVGGSDAGMMPVEESGNMLILLLAIAKMDGNADFASRYWPQLTAWENYLEQYGKDPADQLCTDDFMGHLAHNANLSVKAILAIASYGELCRMRGDQAAADKYQTLAKEYAQHWVQVAGDGDHSRLAFDKPGTWSQKYNLVWDKLLGLNVFPPSVAAREVAYYESQLQPYGLPLDSRTHLTKSDWTVWSATMAESQADFERLVAPMYKYLGETGKRQPFADSYETDKVNSVGMHARPVIGGIFIKMLADPALWKEYAARGPKLGNNYAAAPTPPVVTEVVPTSRTSAQEWRYTTAKPADGWNQPGFDDAAWTTGKGGFGTGITPGAVVGTEWKTDDLWLRRTVTLPADLTGDLQLYLHHDDDAEVYFNGVLAAKEAGYVTHYEMTDIHAAARALLKPGATIVLAIHCHQQKGGQYIDAGLVQEH